jgi:hypothetical protein
MTFDEMAKGPHSRARETVHMVRLTIKHRAGRFKRIVVIEHGDLDIWITSSRTYGFSLEAESLGSSEVGTA